MKLSLTTNRTTSSKFSYATPVSGNQFSLLVTPAFAARPERGDRRRAPHVPGGDAEGFGGAVHGAHDSRWWGQPQRACAARVERRLCAGVVASGREPVPVVSACGGAHAAARPAETRRLHDRCVCAGVCRRRARPRGAVAGAGGWDAGVVWWRRRRAAELGVVAGGADWLLEGRHQKLADLYGVLVVFSEALMTFPDRRFL